MEVLKKFCGAIDSVTDYVAKKKRICMSIFIVLLSIYMILVTKPEVINLEFILVLSIVMIPIIAMASATIDFLTLENGKDLYIKVLTRASVYLLLYFILNLINNKFF